MISTFLLTTKLMIIQRNGENTYTYRMTVVLKIESDRKRCTTLVMMYVETFKTDIIVDIGNMMMCLMSHRLIIFSVRVSKLILTITQTDQE